MRTYLIVYDIHNDKIRTRLAQKIKAAGLIRIQKSVFIGSTKPEKITEILHYGKQNIQPPNDSLIVFPLTNSNVVKSVFLNCPVDIDIILAKKIVLFI